MTTANTITVEQVENDGDITYTLTYTWEAYGTNQHDDLSASDVARIRAAQAAGNLELVGIPTTLVVRDGGCPCSSRFEGECDDFELGIGDFEIEGYTYDDDFNRIEVTL